ncbi:MAG: GNAT family N-acetyltransferase [Bacteroidia bacterium]
MNEITWSCKSFKDLSNKELYEIFRLRISVFVVEQNCPYQDADGKDLKALHVMGKQSAALIAYARILPKNISYEEVSIGRVVTAKEVRRTGAGKTLMEKSMEFIEKEFGKVSVRISAQSYLQKFYEGFGFKRVSDEYMEDDIPHVEMLFEPR